MSHADEKTKVINKIWSQMSKLYNINKNLTQWKYNTNINEKM